MFDPSKQVLLSTISFEQLTSAIASIVREEIRQKVAEELQEKLLSPKEVCKLFHPKISLPTLESWTTKGYLTKHYIGGRTWYKYSQVMAAVKSLKKYKQQ